MNEKLLRGELRSQQITFQNPYFVACIVSRDSAPNFQIVILECCASAFTDSLKSVFERQGAYGQSSSWKDVKLLGYNLRVDMIRRDPRSVQTFRLNFFFDIGFAQH